jgi:tRNA(Arg) A34 adenosine deaminase TadA
VNGAPWSVIRCMGAIVWCGIGRVVFAASVPQIGRLMN